MQRPNARIRPSTMVQTRAIQIVALKKPSHSFTVPNLAMVALVEEY